MEIKISTSAGDVLDRFSILKIKLLHNLPVEQELESLDHVVKLLDEVGREPYLQVLFVLNSLMWDLEDKKRKIQDRFSKEYSDISELITQLNDTRALTKRKCDAFFKSSIKEVKSHADLQ